MFLNLIPKFILYIPSLNSWLIDENDNLWLHLS